MEYSDRDALISTENTRDRDVGINSCKNHPDERIDVQIHEKVTLSFHNLHYEIQQKVDDVPICGKTASKKILCGISGILPPGLNAIMGPTGSGKTSLLDVLARRKDPRGLKDGVVLLNGNVPPDDFRLMSGYVVQDDIVMGTLTVRENLAFSANLRLSNKTFDKQARKDKVEKVIEQLGLQACADTMVGTEFVRGVSGGERKRVNIGMEMILDPPILFLDEPTTGLDANTANSIVLMLYKLASGGRNIVISIHQPRYSIFSLFDRLIILHKGKMVYRGLAKEAVNYFDNIGFSCPTHHNPADFFLDIVGGDVHTAQLIERMNAVDAAVSPHANGFARIDRIERADVSDIVTAMKKDESADHTNYLIEQFNKSAMVLEETRELEIINNGFQSKIVSPNEENVRILNNASYANGFFCQLRAVLQRTVLNILRNPMTSFVQLIIMVIFGVLIGLIYYQTDTSYKSGIQNRAGCFFFLITTQVMSNLSALELFINNRSYFIHESASGYYRVSVYFIAQVFADLIPNRLIPNLIFSGIIYFMIGFQAEVGKFFFFVFALVLTAVCASSLAFFVSASVKIFAVANVVVALPYILMMLFGGFLVNTGSMLDWLEWIKYISIFRYGINALTVNEMSGLIFIDNSSIPGFDPNSKMPCISTITYTYIQNCTTGEIYMDSQDITYGVWGMWQNIVAQAAIGFCFLLLAYFQLLRVNKYK